MKMYLLIKCYEDGDSYQTFDNLENAIEEFENQKADGWFHTLVLCEIGPGLRFGFSDYGFQGTETIKEWSRYYNGEE
jgi:hypothetical protein